MEMRGFGSYWGVLGLCRVIGVVWGWRLGIGEYGVVMWLWCGCGYIGGRIGGLVRSRWLSREGAGGDKEIDIEAGKMLTGGVEKRCDGMGDYRRLELVVIGVFVGGVIYRVSEIWEMLGAVAMREFLLYAFSVEAITGS